MEAPKDSSFIEDDYMRANPDVAQAVKDGQFKNGYEHYELYGRSEKRELYPPKMTRIEKALSALDLSGKGLEIGPSHNPIAPKSSGYDVDILDHLDADGLRKKYSEHNIDLTKIEEVDFVWTGQPLHELINKKSHYDWIIASHVIEHVPDLISFIQQCDVLLKPEGKLSLIVPDKRYCFDYFRSLTSTGEILDAYIEKRTRASPGRVFDFVANTTKLCGNITWSRKHADEDAHELIHTFDVAHSTFKTAIETENYIDIHNWCFIPSSFKLILGDLKALELINLSIATEFDTVSFEFFVTLTKEARPDFDSRLIQLKSIVRDSKGCWADVATSSQPSNAVL